MSEEKNPTSSKQSDGEGDYKLTGSIETIRQLLADKLSLVSTDSDDSAPAKVIDDLTFEGFIKHWKKHDGFKNVITMVGAGISTSAGIPDFRSPGTGLYNNLRKYNLPHPSAIFELDYFLDNPRPFFALAKELYPGSFKPTPSHYFVRLLHDKGLLLRHYTQNIDTLERIAGIPDEKLVEAHGTFHTNHCLGCRKAFSMEWMKEKIFADKIPTCDKCRQLVKPDIVFFGENLPEKFHTLPSKDFESCDLLIIMGTSLEVQPFASLVDHAGPRCVRLLINRTKVGNDGGMFGSWFKSDPGLLYDSPKNTRDVAYIGDCDDGVFALAQALGWGDELRELIKSETEKLEEKGESEDNKKAKEELKRPVGQKDQEKARHVKTTLKSNEAGNSKVTEPSEEEENRQKDKKN